jgi:hypothetical protein
MGGKAQCICCLELNVEMLKAGSLECCCAEKTCEIEFGPG